MKLVSAGGIGCFFCGLLEYASVRGGLQADFHCTVEAGRIYRPTLDGGDFSTYGRVTADRRLVLIAKVPGVRKYTAEVRAAMAAEAWEIASNLGADLDPAPQRIAIGIRGEDEYWEVLEGSPGSEPAAHKRSGDALIAYFSPVLSGGSAESEKKSE